MVIGVNSRVPFVSDLLKYADKTLLNNQLFGDWDIYDTKTLQKICRFDTFLGYEYSDEVEVMSHPIESGSFANYNKVVDPASVGVVLAKSGFPFEIREMVKILEKYKDSTDCVNVVTPYRTYTKYNIKSLSYAIRENSSVNLLVVNLVLTEIREVKLGYKTTGYSANNVANGEYADTKDGGKRKVVEESANNNKRQSLAFAGGKKIIEKIRKR